MGREERTAGIISVSGMLVGAVGIFCGFFFRAQAPHTALAIVTLTTVGIVGLLAFIRHVIFHRADAKRLGWETDRPDWMFEVGFANLAFGGMGLLAVLADWGVRAQAITVLGYALYLFQAALLHGYRYFTGQAGGVARLWRSVIATLVFAGCMGFFALSAVLS